MNADDPRDDSRDGQEPPREDLDLEDPGLKELDFDDPDHAWVTDLLADARVTGPVPDDVAARLDETLAALQAQRAADRETAESSRVVSVVPLRRRLGRLGPALVAAAAAVVVVGGGIGLVRTADTSGSSGSRSADSAGSSAERQSASGQDFTKSAPPAAVAPQTLRGVPELTTASFGSDAARLMRQVALTDGLADLPNDSPRSPAPSDTADGSTATSGSKALQAPPVTATPETQFSAQVSGPCHGPAVSGAVTLQALLDGARVALVFLPPTTTGQEVQAWSCDGASLLTSATITR